MSARTLILDFDGTVCVGDGPMLAYARGAEALHPDLAGLQSRVARFCAGETVPELAGSADGYQAVQRAAAAAGVPVTDLQATFLAARRLLAETGLGTRAPDGLAGLLRDLRAAGTRVLLVTNAPADGLDRMLGHLGLQDGFDDIVADAGKPHGLGGVLDALAHPVTKRTVLAVGDIPLNDLSVPAQRGSSTALVDPFDAHADSTDPVPDVRARRLEELIPWIREWAGLATR